MHQDLWRAGKHSLLRTSLRVFHSLTLVWGPRIYISNKFLGDTGADRSRSSHVENHCLNKESNNRVLNPEELKKNKQQKLPKKECLFHPRSMKSEFLRLWHQKTTRANK